MPTLPTLTVTDAQANRMIAAWGSTAAYKEWLKEQVIQYVIRREADAQAKTLANQQVSSEQTLRNDLTNS